MKINVHNYVPPDYTCPINAIEFNFGTKGESVAVSIPEASSETYEKQLERVAQACRSLATLIDKKLSGEWK